MIKELENVLALQTEVEVLKQKIEAQAKQKETEANISVQKQKEIVEKDLVEIISYLQSSGFTQWAFNVHISRRYNNQNINFKVIAPNVYYLGYTSSGVGYYEKLGFFVENNIAQWDPHLLGNQTPGTISEITDYICQNWQVLKEKIIQDIIKRISLIQKIQLDEALKSLERQTSRIIQGGM